MHSYALVIFASIMCALMFTAFSLVLVGGFIVAVATFFGVLLALTPVVVIEARS